MILFFNAKMGKINKQIQKINFHIWPIFCFRLHIYYRGIKDYDFRDKNAKRRNFILFLNQNSDLTNLAF
jgi:hypothetical protein